VTEPSFMFFINVITPVDISHFDNATFIDGKIQALEMTV
jgi:hypothetical protein